MAGARLSAARRKVGGASGSAQHGARPPSDGRRTSGAAQAAGGALSHNPREPGNRVRKTHPPKGAPVHLPNGSPWTLLVRKCALGLHEELFSAADPPVPWDLGNTPGEGILPGRARTC